jgi:hypothetical protein
LVQPSFGSAPLHGTPTEVCQQPFKHLKKNPLKQLAESGIEEDYLLITRSSFGATAARRSSSEKTPFNSGAWRVQAQQLKE